jgi:hypothetical protein
MNKHVLWFVSVFAAVVVVGFTSMGQSGRPMQKDTHQHETFLRPNVASQGLLALAGEPAPGSTESPSPHPKREERILEKPPVQLEPLTDPSPDQTMAAMNSLRSNYGKVNTLEYTVQVEFEAPDANRNLTKTVRICIPDSAKQPAPLDPSELGFSHTFEGTMDMELKSSQIQMAGKLSEGVFTFTLKDPDASNSDIQSVSQEEMLGRQEAFDSVFFYNYVTWEPEGISPDELESQYFLKSHRSKLRVSRKDGRIISALSYNPRGQIELKQDFVDHYQFPDLGFTFPKTIEMSTYVNGKIDNPMQCVCRITNLKINGQSHMAQSVEVQSS